MSLAWKPRAELPRFDEPTSILIAVPQATVPDGDESITGFLLSQIYIAHGDAVIGEQDQEPPIDVPWYWVTEDEVLAGLPDFPTTPQGVAP